MSTLPGRLDADLESIYRSVLITRAYTPLNGVDNMVGYPEGISSHGDTWADAVADPADPLSHLEHGDHASTSTEERGRRVLPMPALENPERSPNLAPNLADARSRSVSPYEFLAKVSEPPSMVPTTLHPVPGTTLAIDKGKGPVTCSDSAPLADAPAPAGPSHAREPIPLHEQSEEESDGERVIDWSTPTGEDHATIVPGPLKVNQKAKEAFRSRLREALELVGDDSKPLTLSSLTSIVNEITDLDARLSLLERKLDADRRSTRALIGNMARSEAAASERRMQDEVAGLRRQVNAWRLQVPAAPTPIITAPVHAPRPADTIQPQTRVSERGFDYD